MTLKGLRSAGERWNELEEKAATRAPVTVDDGWQLFRTRFPAHNTLTGQEIEERCGGDDQLRGDLHQFVEETTALKELRRREVEAAIRDAQEEINRLRAVVDKARG